MRQLFLFTFLFIFPLIASAQGTIPVTISTTLFYGDIDETIHLKISDTLTNQIWYDSIASVSATDGFKDTVYLDSSTYKCEIIDMGANVNMPSIKLKEGVYAQWGYPDYEYYLFTLPYSEVGQKTLNIKELAVYPNPFVNNLHLDLPHSSNIIKINIFDNVGNLVISKELINESVYELNTSTLLNGIYILKIETNNLVTTKRITKIGE